jgi:DnaJ-class molecular chaperone
MKIPCITCDRWGTVMQRPQFGDSPVQELCQTCDGKGWIDIDLQQLLMLKVIQGMKLK